MFQAKHRLKRKRDIEITVKSGKFVGGALVTAKVWNVHPEKYPKRGFSKDDIKFAVVVGKKIAKSAVARNRVKRKIRESVRLMIKEGMLKEGHFVMIMAKKEALEATYQELAADVQKVLQRGKVLR